MNACEAPGARGPISEMAMTGSFALKKASKGLITQRQAAAEFGQSERHIRRLLKRLKGKGDRSD
jgi:hypothetical protein